MSNIEDGLYGFVLSKKRLSVAIAFVVVVGVLGSTLKFYPYVFNDQNLSYYLFSTVVQGFLALVGVLGAVALFKLQNTENNEKDIVDFARPLLVNLRLGTIANSYSSIQVMDEIKRILAGEHSMDRGLLQVAHDKLEKVFDEKSRIRKAVVDFALWSFITVLLALLGIPLSTLLIHFECYLIMGLYCIIVIGLAIGALFAAFMMIRSILGYTFILHAEPAKFKITMGKVVAKLIRHKENQ